MLQGLDQLFGAFLLRQVRRLLKLAIFLDQPLIKLWKLSFHVILDVLLLIADDLENLIFELRFSLLYELF
jgi:hypothetical protein